MEVYVKQESAKCTKTQKSPPILLMCNNECEHLMVPMLHIDVSLKKAKLITTESPHAQLIQYHIFKTP